MHTQTGFNIVLALRSLDCLAMATLGMTDVAMAIVAMDCLTVSVGLGTQEISVSV